MQTGTGDEDVTDEQPEPTAFNGGFIWCRYDPDDPGIRWPHVLNDEVFDRLTGGAYSPADHEESIMAARCYPTRGDAIADYEKAKVPT